MNCHELSYAEWLDGYTEPGTGKSLRARLAHLVGVEEDSKVMDQLEWLGLLSDEMIKVKDASPAVILEHLLLKKWQLVPTDKDMIIMQHEFEYILEGEVRTLYSTLVMKGKNQEDTAMSRLVGLPLGIFVKLVMQGKIKSKGVNIPVMKEVYDPVLEELKDYDVVFKEYELVLV